MSERGNRKQLVGKVMSAAMDKTVVVQHERLVKDRRYGKYMRKRKKYMVHDEKGEAKVGDIVEMMETRPLSKHKRFRLVRVVREA